MAKDLTIENTAGPNAHQAVAFRSDSDLSIIENCEFIGNQDTVCANTLRQFYKSCRIQGNVDFIFGFSTSIFQDCLILVSPRPQVFPQNNVITAHGRFDPAQSTGFVFLNCTVNGTNEYMMTFYNKRNPSPKEVCKNFLGRPWKEYSRTIFIQCNWGISLHPQDGCLGMETLLYQPYIMGNLTTSATDPICLLEKNGVAQFQPIMSKHIQCKILYKVLSGSQHLQPHLTHNESWPIGQHGAILYNGILFSFIAAFVSP